MIRIDQPIIVSQFFGKTGGKKQIPWTPSFLNLSKQRKPATPATMVEPLAWSALRNGRIFVNVSRKSNRWPICSLVSLPACWKASELARSPMSPLLESMVWAEAWQQKLLPTSGFELAPARRRDQVFQTSGDHPEANYTSQDKSLSPNQNLLMITRCCSAMVWHHMSNFTLCHHHIWSFWAWFAKKPPNSHWESQM